MNQAHFLHQLHKRFFQKNNIYRTKDNSLIKQWEDLDEEKKKELANDFFSQAKKKLFNEDLSAIQLLDIATQLDPNNDDLWYNQGILFFEYGIKQGREKVLILASKSFKIACRLNPKNFHYWWSWAKVLLTLGKRKKEYHYIQEAKKKFQEAIKYESTVNKDILSQFYWDFAKLWSMIADHSGEAIDIRVAIQSFRTSFTYQTQINSSFWHDFGSAYLQMGLLVNDNRLYIQAIDYFEKALKVDNEHLLSRLSLAQTYTQLYINTMNESHYKSANDNFAIATSLEKKDFEIFLEWAQLLGEAGKWNSNPKLLRLSIEKCLIAKHLDEDNPYIIAQWSEVLALFGALTNRIDHIIEAENKIIQYIEIYKKVPELWYAYGCCMNAFALYYDDIEYNELAIEKYQKGLSLESSNAELWHALASTYYRIGITLEDTDLLERANKFYARAADLKPSCPAIIYDHAITLLKLAELSEATEYLDLALYQFEQTLNTQKDAIMQHPEWLFHYAICLDMKGDISEEDENYYLKAIEIFHHVLLIDPDYKKIHFHIAVTYSHLAELTSEKSFFEKANNFFQMAIKQDPEDDITWLEWGITQISFAQHSLSNLEKDQLLAEAEQKLNRSGQLGNQQTLYHLACFYSLKRQFDEAMYFIKKSYDQGVLPSLEELQEDEWLEDLQSFDEYIQFIQQIENKENITDEI